MAGILEALGPIIGAVLVLGIPIIAILVKHQQRMTILMRDQGLQQGNNQLFQLKHDVDSLRSIVNQQTIMLDQIASQQRDLIASLKADDSLKQRLTQ